MKNRLFGTDGIRGMANEYPMTVEMALSVGKAVASFFKSNSGAANVIIGKDTRISGDMLQAALAAGICAMGGNATLVGMMPTPAVAYLTRVLKADAGIVISASHNPFYDNGIKVFGPNGYKLSDQAESDLEMSLIETDWEAACQGVQEPGEIGFEPGAMDLYLSFLRESLPEDFSLKGMRLFLDCANGATCEAAPALFEKLGADVEAYFTEPNGRNINEKCGSQHPEILGSHVVEKNAAAGLAFDGDGDRLVVVDDTGEVLSGDRIVAICARWMQEKGLLKKSQVVTTVMSNLGLKAAFKGLGIHHMESDVGDRYVLDKMITSGTVLGGEDSGHIIFLDHHTTGDGLLAALQLLRVMKDTGLPLSELKKVMAVYPQALINVSVAKKVPFAEVPEVQRAIQAAETELGEKGRVLVRYSGTQPMCRVMVEGPTAEETRKHCAAIADAVTASLGASTAAE